jgi:hypothetical protein
MVERINVHSPAYWAQVAKRLFPLVGDLTKKYGEPWDEPVDRLYSAADREIAIEIISGRTQVPEWHYIEFTNDAPYDFYYEDSVEVFRSSSRALAHLLSRCQSKRFKFDAVEQVSATRFEFIHKGKVLAIIERPNYRSFDDASLSRHKAAIVGVRRSENPAEEYMKRFSRLPNVRLTRCKVGTYRIFQEQQIRYGHDHVPVPKEWLDSARILAADVGIQEPGMKLLQDIACAALGAPSWNHLSAPLGDRSGELLGLWIIDDSSRGYDTATLSRTPWECLAHLTSRFEEFTQSHHSTLLSVHQGLSGTIGLPRFSFKDDDPKWLPENRPPLTMQLEHPTSTDVSFREECTLYEQNTIAPAEAALSAGATAVAEYLGIRSSQPNFQASIDAMDDVHVILETSRWRITGPKKFGYGHGPVVQATYVTPEGRSVLIGTVPAYKAGIGKDLESGTYFLTREYHCSNPAVALLGLTESDANHLMATFPQNMGDFVKLTLTNRERETVLEKFHRLVSEYT